MISVILPTYNEAGNIEDLIYKIDSIINPFEIIVVDDNSPDGTWKIVEKIGTKNKKVKLLRRFGKKGLATAVSEGVSVSQGDVLIWLDCDFSQPPELMPELLRTLDRCDIALASRFVDGGGMEYDKIRVITSILICWFARLVLDPSIKDYTSGYLAIRKKVLEDAKIRELGKGYGEYFIDMLYRAKKKGYRIEEVPYTYFPRRFGETKTYPNIFVLLKWGISYCLSIVKMRFDERNMSTRKWKK